MEEEFQVLHLEISRNARQCGPVLRESSKPRKFGKNDPEKKEELTNILGYLVEVQEEVKILLEPASRQEDKWNHLDIRSLNRNL